MNENIEIQSTKASRLGEFMNQGDWRFNGSFVILPPYFVSDGHGGGKWIEERIYGKVRGENLRYCYFCGTTIQEHITLKDSKTGREVNIGNVCIDKLSDALDDRELNIHKGLKSLRNKVIREFKKKIHRKDLLEFLDANMDKWQKKVNEKVDIILKDNPKAFYNPEEKIFSKQNGEQIKIKRTLWEQKNGSEQREFEARNPIRVLRDKFESAGWNVNPMIPEFEKLIAEQGFDVKIPKPRTLTKDELNELAKHIQANVDEYLKRGIKK